MIKPFQETEIAQTFILLGFELDRDFKYGHVHVWYKGRLVATFKSVDFLVIYCFEEKPTLKDRLEAPRYEILDAWKGISR